MTKLEALREAVRLQQEARKTPVHELDRSRFWMACGSLDLPAILEVVEAANEQNEANIRHKIMIDNAVEIGDMPNLEIQTKTYVAMGKARKRLSSALAALEADNG